MIRGQAMQDSMWKGGGGFEIALTPAILGFFGWMLDVTFGIVPALTIVGVVLGFSGAVANQYYRYKHDMDIATAERMAKQGRSEAPASSGPFGPVEYEEVDMSIDFNTARRPGELGKAS